MKLKLRRPLLFTLAMLLCACVFAPSLALAADVRTEVGKTVEGRVHNSSAAYRFDVKVKQEVTFDLVASLTDTNAQFNGFAFLLVKYNATTGKWDNVSAKPYDFQSLGAIATTDSFSLILDAGAYGIAVSDYQRGTGLSPVAYSIALRDTSKYATAVSAPASVTVTQYKEAKTVNIGAKAPAGAVVGPIEWKSGNSAVATASFVDGVTKVSGKKAGTCELTGKLKSGKTFKLKVVVKPNVLSKKVSRSVKSHRAGMLSLSMTKVYYDASGKLKVDVVFVNRTSTTCTFKQVRFSSRYEGKAYVDQTLKTSFKLKPGALTVKTFTLSKTPSLKADISGKYFSIYAYASYSYARFYR